MGNSQLVASQSPGFIGTDDLHGAEGFNGIEAGNQDILASHAQAAHGQRQGKSRQQPFRNISNNDPHHKNQVDPQRSTAENAIAEKGKPESDSDKSQHPYHMRGLSFQRRRSTTDRLRKVSQFAEFGA